MQRARNLFTDFILLASFHGSLYRACRPFLLYFTPYFHLTFLLEQGVGTCANKSHREREIGSSSEIRQIFYSALAGSAEISPFPMARNDLLEEHTTSTKDFEAHSRRCREKGEFPELRRFSLTVAALSCQRRKKKRKVSPCVSYDVGSFVSSLARTFVRLT